MEKLTPNQEYDAVVAAGAASLKPGEFWMIGHAEGLLEETASVDLAYPVRVFCEATGLDWDEARDAGYFLTRAKLSKPASVSKTGRPRASLKWRQQSDRELRAEGEDGASYGVDEYHHGTEYYATAHTAAGKLIFGRECRSMQDGQRMCEEKAFVRLSGRAKATP